MADYHRFVSYIYLYEKGTKAVNTGFARVESRDGLCRVDISMRNMYHENNVRFMVYMFVRRKDTLAGIYLGDLATENNVGTFSCHTQSDSIEGSGYSLEQMSGMIIQGSNGRIYGTGWDDEAISVERFEPMTERPKTEGIVETKRPETGRPEEEHTESERIVETKKESAAEVKEEFAAGMKAEKEAEVPGASEAMEAEVAERTGASSELKAEGAERLIASEALETGDSYLAAKSAEPAAGASGEAGVGMKDAAGASGEAGFIFEAEAKKKSEAVPEKKVLNIMGKQEISEKPITVMEKTDAVQMAQSEFPVRGLSRILEKGLRMYPFEDDQVTACIRMEPQEMGLLPMKYWPLANNSFLLHGYYSYRHLIMAQMKDGRFILGIPGVNYEREQFMASRFGFGKFKSIQKQAPVGNCFGYWYMELKE